MRWVEVAPPLAALWRLSLSLRSVTACWLCSWATLGIGSTVLVSLASADCLWLSVPWCWPYLTSCPSPTITTPCCTVRWSYEYEPTLLLCLRWYHCHGICDSVQRWGVDLCPNTSKRLMRLFFRVAASFNKGLSSPVWLSVEVLLVLSSWTFEWIRRKFIVSVHLLKVKRITVTSGAFYLQY